MNLENLLKGVKKLRNKLKRNLLKGKGKIEESHTRNNESMVGV